MPGHISKPSGDVSSSSQEQDLGKTMQSVVYNAILLKTVKPSGTRLEGGHGGVHQRRSTFRARQRRRHAWPGREGGAVKGAAAEKARSAIVQELFSASHRFGGEDASPLNKPKHDSVYISAQTAGPYSLHALELEAFAELLKATAMHEHGIEISLGCRKGKEACALSYLNIWRLHVTVTGARSAHQQQCLFGILLDGVDTMFA